ncbi:MAG: UvrD-helicase domain-containing protein [Candidatus Hydrogenedentota bacterium]
MSNYNILDDLNEKQREAVTCTEGPLLIFAGAGTGKTRVITYRIAYLISECNIAPETILAVTFTNKAAIEMKNRVRKLLGRESLNVFVSTFHSFGARLLRRYGQKIDISNDFVIYDETDSELLIKRILLDFNIDPKKIRSAGILNIIERAKDRLLSTLEFDKLYEKGDRDNYYEIAKTVYSEYEKNLRKNNACDFGDLIYLAVKLLNENHTTLEKVRKRFQYVMVDEYQDTNYAQFMLIYLISQEHRNIAVVGDDDQAIYGWRGADITNILNFEKVFSESNIVKLEQNYRSTSSILDSAYAVVRNNRDRKEKRLWTERERGRPPTVKLLADEKEEARYVLKNIYKFINAGYKYRDIAIFYRIHSLSRVFEDILRKENIPYKVVGGIGFYQRKEIKDILAYLKFIINFNDDVSLSKIINIPSRGIGHTTLKKARDISLLENKALFDVLKDGAFLQSLGPQTAKSVIDFVNMIYNWKKTIKKKKVSEIINDILKETGYIDGLKDEATIEAVSRIENLQEFLNVAVEFEEKKQGDLIEFLMEMALLTDLDFLADESDYVTLMTMHMAKGLEFPCVFIVGMEAGIFPHSSSEFDIFELSEERRLCYVGITRAKDYLFISHCASRMIYGKRIFQEPSMFIDELRGDTVKRDHKNDGFTIKDETKEVCDFKKDDIVFHSRYGKGVVLSRRGAGEDAVYRVRFSNNNEKTLIHKYARLSLAE